MLSLAIVQSLHEASLGVEVDYVRFRALAASPAFAPFLTAKTGLPQWIGDALAAMAAF